MPRHGRHDPLVLLRVAVAVVDVGHRAGPVIGDPVHRVAAEAEPGDPRQAGAPQIVRRGALDPELGDQLPLSSALDLLPPSPRGGSRSAPARAPTATPGDRGRSWCPATPCGLPGICHQPSAICSRCMAATSPGRWPVRRISFSAGSSFGHSRRDLGVGQDALAVRGRIAVDQLARIDGEDLLLDRPREDRLAAARAWLATIGASIRIIMARTSARVMAVAFSLPQRGRR